MRLFFAVIIPPEIAARAQEAQQALRDMAGEEGIRWARPEQFHYTIAFLGEQPAVRAQKAVECAQFVRESQAPFDFTLGGLGAFPSNDRPSALWIGAVAGADALAAMASRLGAMLLQQSLPRESRAFKPHLTLGRVKTYKGEIMSSRALRKLAEDDRWSDLGTFTIDHFVLMRSTLSPHGSEYTPVEEFGFVS